MKTFVEFINEKQNVVELFCKVVKKKAENSIDSILLLSFFTKNLNYS